MGRAFAVAVAVLVGMGVAWAENRTFVIANTPDGYGVDQCLASGAPCGNLVANAFCQSKEFARAASFRRVEPGEVTAFTPAASATGTGHDNFVAIECRR